MNGVCIRRISRTQPFVVGTITATSIKRHYLFLFFFLFALNFTFFCLCNKKKIKITTNRTLRNKKRHYFISEKGIYLFERKFH